MEIFDDIAFSNVSLVFAIGFGRNGSRPFDAVAIKAKKIQRYRDISRDKATIHQKHRRVKNANGV